MKAVSFAANARCWAALFAALGVILCGCSRGTTPGLVGNTAPDFTVNSSNGPVELKKLEGPKIIVLNFWATWCPPCVTEIPSLAAMQLQLQNKVEVYAVSVDEDPEAYRRFLQEHGISFLTVRDPSEASNHLYGTQKFPETYIIDRRGVVRRKFIGPVDWTSPEIMNYLQSL